jgi:hypothetical protein
LEEGNQKVPSEKLREWLWAGLLFSFGFCATAMFLSEGHSIQPAKIYDKIILIEALAGCLKYHGTIFNTCTASGATIFDDSAGPFFDFDFEISRGSFYTFKVRIGNQFNVQVPADLDQFR